MGIHRAMKPWMILCCSCGRLLNKDATMGCRVMVDGVYRWGSIEHKERIADFQTHEAADQFASDHGWSIRDSEGPNHRCPECRPVQVERRGAYLPTSLLTSAADSRAAQSESVKP